MASGVFGVEVPASLYEDRLVLPGYDLPHRQHPPGRLPFRVLIWHYSPRSVEWSIRDLREAVEHNDVPEHSDITEVLNAFENLTKDLEEVRYVPIFEVFFTLEEWVARPNKRASVTVQEDIDTWTRARPILYRKKMK